jgi:hypothetical protein
MVDWGFWLLCTLIYLGYSLHAGREIDPEWLLFFSLMAGIAQIAYYLKQIRDFFIKK